MQKATVFLFSVILCLLIREGSAQDTVFGLLKGDEKSGDKSFEQRNYYSALQYYLNARSSNQDELLSMKIARCYHLTKKHTLAINEYEQLSQSHKLSAIDAYYYAEAQLSTGNVQDAIAMYRVYLKEDSGDHLVIKKLWRLENIEFLYEDSLHFAVRELELNSLDGEFCAVPFRNGLVFLSNKKEVRLIDKMDASTNAPFYRMYRAEVFPDTLTNIGALMYGHVTGFAREIGSKFHAGPVAFYGQAKKMVFCSTSGEENNKGRRTLQLYFAEEENGKWKITGSFAHNSPAYSITDPAINEAGNILYFSSDMKGGFGNRDLYKSALIDGTWSVPENLGENINTLYDEVFPHLHQNETLYFSSNGHAGMGGLDIFKIETDSLQINEVQNMGYPINSHADDFGISIDSLLTHGYLSSNRKAGGYDDDVFEFDIDLQNYPITIAGVINYKEHNWHDSTELKVFANAHISLIDNIRDIVVYECKANADGNFSLVIPYFSKYKIKVLGEANDEHVVSLEIPRTKVMETHHEIVVIKDSFKTTQN
jgi:hypothetical protein